MAQIMNAQKPVGTRENVEYDFFKKLFAAMEKSGNNVGISARFDTALKNRPNGEISILPWNQVGWQGITTYRQAIPEAGLVIERSKDTIFRSEMKNMIDQIVAWRDADLAAGAHRGDDPYALRQHENILDIWREMRSNLAV
ncbi:hypothetical protein CHS0354_001287 [Potamilus streckersoni]|uniref:Uncharacterized protein n=1 Tax=Potamilus streckersoni TaxID=2493646 RepID=A0AAE0S7Y4_9BIVA|nr:hypothetical protein CHS0354_001287 [Potamilus streckersoni]